MAFAVGIADDILARLAEPGSVALVADDHKPNGPPILPEMSLAAHAKWPFLLGLGRSPHKSVCGGWPIRGRAACTMPEGNLEFPTLHLLFTWIA